MRKLEDDELGILLTREMLSMMKDTSLNYEQRGRLFCSIVFGEKLKDGMMSSFANSLKTGFERINNNRKAGIYSRRKRQKEYAKNLRASTHIDEDMQTSTDIEVGERVSLGIAKQCKAKHNNIPPKSPRGDCGDEPPMISAEDLLSVGMNEEQLRPKTPAARQKAALELAETIRRSEAFPRMRVNNAKLVKCLVGVLKKNSAAAVLVGLGRWTEAWKAGDWRYAPGRITDWLTDEKFLEEPISRKKKAAEHKPADPLPNNVIV